MLYKGVRAGLSNKLKSEQRSEVENSRQTLANLKVLRQECASEARVGVKAGRAVRDEA